VTTLELADGRTLEYVVAGPADGTPLLFHNGTPSAALLFEPLVATAAEHGLQTVTYSRAGFHRRASTPSPPTRRSCWFCSRVDSC
jgi:pimeloyl-ACP methyl ester carboxylesterase